MPADTEKQQKAIANLNRETRHVADARVVSVEAVGQLELSKLAWKLTGYHQALLHRITALMDGVAVAMNAQSTLTAMLASRAVMETVAAYGDLHYRAEALLGTESLSELDTLATEGTFATRDEDLLKEIPEIKAQNIMSVMARFERRSGICGFAAHFERLSERCHPNGLGHYFMFGRLAKNTATVTFSNEQQHGSNRDVVIAACLPILAVSGWSARLVATIDKIADLQHRIDPVVRS